MRRREFALVMVMCLVGAGDGYAADSPEFRGPNRDGEFPETGLLKEWPEGGPPLVWVAKGLGKGYSSPSIVGDTIYVTGMLEDKQGYVFELDLDGVEKSKILYGEETQDMEAPGARSTPTIDGNRLYLMSGLGVVYCFEREGRKKLWEVDTVDRFGGQTITWSIAESVLVDGNRLICTPGGPDASVVALDKMTGETIWTSKGLSDASGYCSADIIEHRGRRIIITMTAKYVVGLDAGSGQVLWKHSHPMKYDIHAVTPVYADGMLYFTAGGEAGGGMLELSPDGAEITLKWTDKNLDCLHHGVVLVDGFIYGTNEQKRGRLICLELKTGRMMWSTNEIKQGAVIYADGMFYVYEGPKAGVVSLIQATPEGLERTGSFQVSEGTDNHWAHPAIAGGRLYIRHGDALIAYDIKAD